MNVAIARSRQSWIADQLDRLAEYGRDGAGGMTRLAYSVEDLQAQHWFTEVCSLLELTVRRDGIGNLIARREGDDCTKPAVALGSHLDTVLNGGRFDGALGVVAALDVVRRLNENKVSTIHPLEVIVFAAEESTRFGVSTIGSKAIAGMLRKDEAFNWTDRTGQPFPDVLRSCNLDPEQLDRAVRAPDSLKAFLELHIEQGVSLEYANCQIGVVHAIAAPTRLKVRVIGQAGHSGTTVMHLRHDALTAAAEIVLAVERLALEERTFQSVGTVGVQDVKPGSPNTIPGLVEMVVEFRSINAEAKQALVAELIKVFAKISEMRGVHIEHQIASDESPVSLNSDVCAVLKDVCSAQGVSYLDMVSGAGHDAMNMAYVCPTGLLFVPCRHGVSHHPDEYACEEDILIGADVLYEAVLRLAGRKPQ
ncbi:Zn-dependent hydrolase [Alicyclobacillus fastidiosus]|uniref:Zn-dependent hydrolase n=1 Tax=Alicyclobacillus fastidiosus TaxID=392011 RepID=A0ABY6ZLN2_9BACL|nr:Zn-dependent hydrolase [Alicyclobacillus fastidiosus]WAH43101.1 Zn-dependent hydrolase [Alicyclobacillus fastidiosus]GMA65100.1 putative hydrolase [Alicyclobacillus fastidiosus]